MRIKKGKTPSAPIELVAHDFSEEYLKNLSILYDFNLTFSHRAYFVMGLFAVSLFIGLFSKYFLWFGAAGVYVLFSQYTRLKRISQVMEIKREVLNHKIRKGDMLNIVYTIRNRSQWTLPAFTLQDFSHYLDYKKSASFLIVDEVKKNSRYQLKTHPHCEAPLGEWPLGVMQIEMQDEFGLFRFKKNYHDNQVLWVAHQQSSSKQGKVRRAIKSPFVGDMAIPEPGQGLSLYGLREYREGDPFKIICWKKSLADMPFIVKEFERDISRRVIFQISQEAASQMGYGVSSTWELAKAMTLHMISQYLLANSAVSLITEEIQLKDLSGKHMYELFEKTIHKMCLHREAGESLWNSRWHTPLETDQVHYHLKPSGLYYFISSQGHAIEEQIKNLLILKAEGFEPCFIYISPLESFQIVKKIFKPTVALKTKEVIGNRSLHEKFIRAGIPLIIVKAATSLGEYKVERYG